MKKCTTVLLILAMVLSLFSLAACQETPQGGETAEPKTGMFYKVDGFAETVYCISESDMTPAELTMITSLQGVLAQTKATIYIEGSEGATTKRLGELAKKYGFVVETVTDPWLLVDIFAEAVDGKYVLYNDHSNEATMVTDQTINYATTISGAEGWLMIGRDVEATAKEHGLTLGADAAAEQMNTRYIFETYKDKLNNTYLVHQDPTNRSLRDYAIAGKAMCFYADMYDGDNSVKEDILNWAAENAPILGWTANELNFVSANSLQSVVTIAADHAVNLSLYAAGKEESLTQSNYADSKITAEPGKHYVAIVMSDGDNVQWMTRGFAESSKYYGSPYRGAFPMTWTTSPALYDLAPDVLGSLYQRSTDKDYFISGPSGVGYINATEYNTESIDDYAAYTAGYMAATDLEYINFLDNYVDETMLDHFAAYDQVKGGVWSVGNKYIEGEGAVYWSNGKPFVAARETLWRIAGDDESNQYYGFVERVAQRINEYSTDCTKIEGYTVVLAHAWSVGSMDYINRFVDALDEDVVLVTVDQLIDLVSENVAKENAVPEDISPWDLADVLVPVSSEQYDYDALTKVAVSDSRQFSFAEERLGGWLCGTSGLEYDFSGIKNSMVMLDGSDLEDVVDPMPNAWIYNKFTLSTESDKDNWLSLLVDNGDNNVDVNMRVRVLYQEDGTWRSETLVAEEYDKPVNDYGYLCFDDQSSSLLNYDLAPYKGKTILLSIEQDDTGDGTGETLYVHEIILAGTKYDKGDITEWLTNMDISLNWQKEGSVSTHIEGICLEAESASASLYKQFAVTEQTKYLKFFVRTFIREGDVNPTLQGHIGDTVLSAVAQQAEVVEIDKDLYQCIIFDLSDYVGQEITFRLTASGGDHACIAQIVAAGFYVSGETEVLYTAEQVGRN